MCSYWRRSTSSRVYIYREAVHKGAAAAAEGVSAEHIEKKTKALTLEYYGLKEAGLKEAALCVAELKLAPAQQGAVLGAMAKATYTQKGDLSALFKLMGDLVLHLLSRESCAEGGGSPVFGEEAVANGAVAIIGRLTDACDDLPRAPELVGALLARLMLEGPLKLAGVGKAVKEADEGDLVEWGPGLLLVCQILRAVANSADEAKAKALLDESGLKLDELLGADDKEAGLAAFLEKKKIDLAFLA